MALDFNLIPTTKSINPNFTESVSSLEGLRLQSRQKTEEMVKEMNDQRRLIFQKVSQTRSILKMSTVCANLLLKKATLPASVTLEAATEAPLDVILKLITTKLECFLRVRKQKKHY